MDPEGQDGDGLSEAPDYVPDFDGPWETSLHLACSDDGLNWTVGPRVIQRADVPHLLRVEDGRLLATFQYFSYTDPDHFNVFFSSTSSDGGKTWTEATAVEMEGLPAPSEDVADNQPVPVPLDPTLVQLSDGRLRLYFTYWAEGDDWLGLHSAVADEVGGVFAYEAGPLLDLDAELRDPSVVWHDGRWHHFAQVATAEDMGKRNYHSTSSDGVHFSREEDVVLDIMMLGNAVSVDGGLRFYGSNRVDMITAFTEDGFDWELEDGIRVEGSGDPGVAELDDGWLMILPFPTDTGEGD